MIMDLERLIQLCCESHKVVSIVGAGGKTTLMYELAEKCSRGGLHVLVSTTTHIAEPDTNLAMEEKDVLELWQNGSYAVVGRKAADHKLSMLPVGRLRALMKKADLTLLEADGSRRLPCKVPGEHEPVILPESSLVIGVMGMSCIGKKMKECCFRFESAGKILKTGPDAIISEELAVSILTSDAGTKKGVGEREFVVVLNQCDTEEIRRKAERIAGGLREKGTEKVVLTCFLRKRWMEDAGFISDDQRI